MFDCSCIPSFSELTYGWTSKCSDKINLPVTQKIIEKYLIKIATERVFYRKWLVINIQVKKICKEKYIHKIMANKITEEHRFFTFGNKAIHQLKK